MTTKLLLKTYKTQIMNICPSCGNKLTDDQAKFCPRCGTKLKYLLSGEMTFGKAISNFWSNYFNFSGRATPPEFWYIVLFFILINIILLPISIVLPPLGLAWFLATFFPWISLHVRRFRDAGKNFGIWLLIFLGIWLGAFVLTSLPFFITLPHIFYSRDYHQLIVFLALIISICWYIYGFIILVSPSNYPTKVSTLFARPSCSFKMVKIPNTNFSISKYPITQQEYFDVIKKDPSQFSGDPSLPVENVSWYEAMRFCKTLTVAKRKSGEISQNQEYRLPTSEQWEFACRAGTTTKYCSGNTDKDLSSVAWWGGQTKKTHPVGQKSPNAWGIYDMHGNVWEWCLNAHPRYKTHAIIRGGSYRNGAYYCESSYTDSKDANTRSNNIGFRIILITE